MSKVQADWTPLIMAESAVEGYAGSMEGEGSLNLLRRSISASAGTSLGLRSRHRPPAGHHLVHVPQRKIRLKIMLETEQRAQKILVPGQKALSPDAMPNDQRESRQPLSAWPAVVPPSLTPFSFPLSHCVPVLAKDADPLTRHVLTLLHLSSCLSASEGCDSGAEK